MSQAQVPKKNLNSSRLETADYDPHLHGPDAHGTTPQGAADMLRTRQGVVEWYEGQTNGIDQVCECPYISNDLVELKEIAPVNPYRSEQGLELRLVSIHDKDNSEEPDDQILGQWTSAWSGLTVPINQFRWNLVGPDFTICIYGKRRTGKTHFLKCLLWQMRPHFRKVVVFTKTKFNGELVKLFPDSVVINHFTPKLLTDIMEAQKKDVKAARDYAEKTGEPTRNERLLIVCDDVLSGGEGGSKVYRYNEAIDKAFFEGRHYLVSFVCTSQDSKGLPPNLKQNTDLSVFFQMQARRDRETIGDNCLPFLHSDLDIRDFFRCLHRYKHQFIAVLNCKASRPIEEQVFIGITTPEELLPLFVMGCYASWKEKDLKQLTKLGFEYLAYDPTDEGWNIESYLAEKPKPRADRVNGMGFRPRPVSVEEQQPRQKPKIPGAPHQQAPHHIHREPDKRKSDPGPPGALSHAR